MTINTGWIKTSCSNGSVIEDGITYYISYKKYQIIVLKVTKAIQKFLWKYGIAVHDPIFGECTPDFNCCCNIGRKAFLKFPAKGQRVSGGIWR